MDLLASVIVPVRNGRRDLPGLVESLSAQTVPRGSFEIVIADDGSTDGSTDGLATDDGWIRVTHGPPQNSYAARNRAVRESRGPVLAFCDADCRPEPEWLEAGLRALRERGAAGGMIRFIAPERASVWTLLDLENKDHELQLRHGRGETANLFVRRELFERLGGFDDSLPEHGDFDFVARCADAEGGVGYAADAVVWHPTRDRARPFLRNEWIMNRWYAARETRAGGRPHAAKLRYWLPVVPPIRWRRRWGLSLRLDRRRLAVSGFRPRLRDDLRALPLMYVVVPYFRGAAQLRGWVDGLRLR
jgi:glycosyltransferase involved in cell wall biosynthesis